jgi:hypothetical protein
VSLLPVRLMLTIIDSRVEAIIKILVEGKRF